MYSVRLVLNWQTNGCVLIPKQLVRECSADPGDEWGEENRNGWLSKMLNINLRHLPAPTHPATQFAKCIKITSRQKLKWFCFSCLVWRCFSLTSWIWWSTRSTPGWNPQWTAVQIATGVGSAGSRGWPVRLEACPQQSVEVELRDEYIEKHIFKTCFMRVTW